MSDDPKPFVFAVRRTTDNKVLATFPSLESLVAAVDERDGEFHRAHRLTGEGPYRIAFWVCVGFMRHDATGHEPRFATSAKVRTMQVERAGSGTMARRLARGEFAALVARAKEGNADAE